MKTAISWSALGLGTAAAVALSLPSTDAHACGCFAPQQLTVPIVQAGERILFAHQNGEVVAHIQIQYEGEASQFGWLLPLPSAPSKDDLELSVEELFTTLLNQTQPSYRLLRQGDDACINAPTASTNFESGGGRGDQGTDPDLVVIQGSVGPFDYVVLDAKDGDEMLAWLRREKFVVPDTADAALSRYLGEGKFLLALKLSKGNDVGDIQPIVVRYRADRPMIPIILTSIGANPNMGIQVWVLGNSRAIPRNYSHTILNEEYIDWFSGGSNYNDVIINATNEAREGQAFVTEYAGPSTIVQGQLNWENRFGSQSAFESQTEAGSYVQMLRIEGFPWNNVLMGVLRRTFPMPQALLDEGVTEEAYYESLDFYLNRYRSQNPDVFEGIDLTFDAVEVTAEIWEKIVVPTVNAEALLNEFPKLTRMYTTLSPNEMTRDPEFSFNPTLPDVSNVHRANFTFDCDNPSRGVLELPDGRQFYIEDQNEWANRDRPNIPYSRRIEALPEEGAPAVLVDNTTRITPSEFGAEGCGCSASTPDERNGGWAGIAALLLLGALARRRWRA